MDVCHLSTLLIEDEKLSSKQARNAKGWTIDNNRWLVEASQVLEPDTNWQASDYVEQRIFAPGVSLSTWRRFLRGKAINSEVFKAFCQVLGIDWTEIIEFTLNKTNVGLPLKLAPFNWEQIQDLAQRHGIGWGDNLPV